MKHVVSDLNHLTVLLRLVACWSPRKGQTCVSRIVKIGPRLFQICSFPHARYVRTHVHARAHTHTHCFVYYIHYILPQVYWFGMVDWALKINCLCIYWFGQNKKARDLDIEWSLFTFTLYVYYIYIWIKVFIIKILWHTTRTSSIVIHLNLDVCWACALNNKIIIYMVCKYRMKLYLFYCIYHVDRLVVYYDISSCFSPPRCLNWILYYACIAYNCICIVLVCIVLHCIWSLLVNGTHVGYQNCRCSVADLSLLFPLVTCTH